jgi:hypothetical protein
MNQRGKKGVAALAVVPPPTELITAKKRLQPPENLSPELLDLWQRTVDSKPADWFGAEHAPMVESYCRHMHNARTIGKALDTVPAEWLVDPEGLKRYDRLYAMHERETRAASALATRMRLTQLSVIDKRVAGTKGQNFQTSRKPWDPPE